MKKKDLDLAGFEKPVLGKKPTKPANGSTYLEKTKEEKKVFWSSSSKKSFPILDVLKDVPKDVDLNDVAIWCSSRMVSDYYGYNSKASGTIHVGIFKEMPNPKYTAALAKYEADLAKYNEDLAKWEKDSEEYDQKLEIYKKYKDLIDVRDQAASLKKKLADLKTSKIKAEQVK